MLDEAALAGQAARELAEELGVAAAAEDLELCVVTRGESGSVGLTYLAPPLPRQRCRAHFTAAAALPSAARAANPALDTIVPVGSPDDLARSGRPARGWRPARSARRRLGGRPRSRGPWRCGSTTRPVGPAPAQNGTLVAGCTGQQGAGMVASASAARGAFRSWPGCGRTSARGRGLSSVHLCFALAQFRRRSRPGSPEQCSGRWSFEALHGHRAHHESVVLRARRPDSPARA